MKRSMPINTAKLLKSWRAELGLSQSGAAAVLGVSVRTYQGWEAGKRFLYPTLLKLALSAVPAP